MLFFFQIPESSSLCSATHLGVGGARPPKNGGLTAQLRSKISAVVVAVVLLLIERGQAWRVPSHARFQLGLRQENHRGKPVIGAAAAGTTIMDHDTFPGEGTATVSSKVWGVLDGKEVHRIDLDTQGGFGVSFCTYGATLLSVRAGDRTGKIEEVTLQHETLEDLAAGTAYYGSTVGRVCNRISGATFVVEGDTFTLGANNGPNCLHSGFKAFDKVLWRHKIFKGDSDTAVVCFELDSPDMDQGFPGALSVKVTYSIRQGGIPGTGELHSSLEAAHIAAAGEERRLVPTPINLTNHAYWNLSGSCKRLVRDHELFLRCDRYLPLDGNQIPTGELTPVVGTFFDFYSKARPLGDAIDGIGGDPPGLDHCLVTVGASFDGKAEVAENSEELPLVARLQERQTGRVMEVSASQPGVQVYTANFLSVDPVDMPHLRHNAVCLETQHFPNAVNQPEWADSVLIPPGGVYKERARHVFTVSALTEK